MLRRIYIGAGVKNSFYRKKTAPSTYSFASTAMVAMLMLCPSLAYAQLEVPATDDTDSQRVFLLQQSIDKDLDEIDARLSELLLQVHSTHTITSFLKGAASPFRQSTELDEAIQITLSLRSEIEEYLAYSSDEFQDPSDDRIRRAQWIARYQKMLLALTRVSESLRQPIDARTWSLLWVKISAERLAELTEAPVSIAGLDSEGSSIVVEASGENFVLRPGKRVTQQFALSARHDTPSDAAVFEVSRKTLLLALADDWGQLLLLGGHRPGSPEPPEAALWSQRQYALQLGKATLARKLTDVALFQGLFFADSSRAAALSARSTGPQASQTWMNREHEAFGEELGKLLESWPVSFHDMEQTQAIKTLRELISKAKFQALLPEFSILKIPKEEFENFSEEMENAFKSYEDSIPSEAIVEALDRTRSEINSRDPYSLGAELRSVYLKSLIEQSTQAAQALVTDESQISVSVEILLQALKPELIKLGLGAPAQAWKKRILKAQADAGYEAACAVHATALSELLRRDLSLTERPALMTNGQALWLDETQVHELLRKKGSLIVDGASVKPEHKLLRTEIIELHGLGKLLGFYEMPKLVERLNLGQKFSPEGAPKQLAIPTLGDLPLSPSQKQAYRDALATKLAGTPILTVEVRGAPLHQHLATLAAEKALSQGDELLDEAQAIQLTHLKASYDQIAAAKSLEDLTEILTRSRLLREMFRVGFPELASSYDTITERQLRQNSHKNFFQIFDESYNAPLHQLWPILVMDMALYFVRSTRPIVRGFKSMTGFMPLLHEYFMTTLPLLGYSISRDWSKASLAEKSAEQTERIFHSSPIGQSVFDIDDYRLSQDELTLARAKFRSDVFTNAFFIAAPIFSRTLKATMLNVEDRAILRSARKLGLTETQIPWDEAALTRVAAERVVQMTANGELAGLPSVRSAEAHLKKVLQKQIRHREIITRDFEASFRSLNFGPGQETFNLRKIDQALTQANLEFERRLTTANPKERASIEAAQQRTQRGARELLHFIQTHWSFTEPGLLKQLAYGTVNTLRRHVLGREPILPPKSSEIRKSLYESIYGFWERAGANPGRASTSGASPRESRSWAKADYYADLGVSDAASRSEIQTAYRKAAGRWHPDRNPGDAEAQKKFVRATEAWEVLGDSDHRARYDLFRLEQKEVGGL